MQRITITVDKELLNWLDSRIKDKTYANRSHALEALTKKRMERERQNIPIQYSVKFK